MKELISHIEFLLLQHEYVIIPNIGGFVLNREHAYVHESGFIMPPVLSVGFNAELKYNDGLLAESYMQKHAISYDTALARIDADVKQIKSELTTRQAVSFGRLGALKLDDGHIIYESSSQNDFNHPGVWGYSAVELKPLSDILSSANGSSGAALRIRRVVVGVASTAAAVALWAMFPSINENLFQAIQHSGFYVNMNNVERVAKSIEYKSPVSTERDAILDEYAGTIAERGLTPVVEEQVRVVVAAEELKPAKESPKPVFTNVKYYYVIVGGDVNKNRAKNLLSNFKAKGFKNAALVESPERYRVYVAMFKDKTEADTFLTRFRAKHPAYQDAWLFAKSTKMKS
ncbi:HU domain-containing protein [Viscerimonas tarda]